MDKSRDVRFLDVKYVLGGVLSGVYIDIDGMNGGIIPGHDELRVTE